MSNEQSPRELAPTARLVQVIQTTLTRRGDGTDDNPIRVVVQYFDMQGQLLAEYDPWLREALARLEKAGDDSRDAVPAIVALRHALALKP